MFKYLERRVADPGILIFEENDHTRYFICNTKEDYCKVAMKVLRERLQMDWYYDDEDEEAVEQEVSEYIGVIRKKKEVIVELALT